MNLFFTAAFPWIMTGIALAILAVQCGRNKAQGKQIAAGAGLGLVLGVALNQCGLWESHVLGVLLGLLWGMALGSLYQPPEANTDRKPADKDQEH